MKHHPREIEATLLSEMPSVFMGMAPGSAVEPDHGMHWGLDCHAIPTCTDLLTQREK